MKRLTRLEKMAITKELKKTDPDELDELIITTPTGRTYQIKVVDGKAILPSGKAFEIDMRHIC